MTVLARVLAGFGVIVATGVFACQAATNLACVPGRSQPCACSAGTRGLQTCLPDGSAFDTCAFCVTARAGFTDISDKSGLPANGGPCLGFEDFDGDGKLDVIVSNMGPNGGAPGPTAAPHIAVYAGAGGGSFSKKPVATLTDGFSMLCAMGDVDRDGKADVIVGLSANGMKGEMSSHVQYYKNLGGFKFELQTKGFDDDNVPDRQMYALAVWDYDKDGWLDIMVGRARGGGATTADDCYFSKDGSDYACHGMLITGSPAPAVYRNDKGTFKLLPNVMGGPNPGTTNAIAFADIDHDGETDVFMSNDFYFNTLQLKRKNGYEHHEHPCGIDQYNHGMGAAIADYNGDGLYDIYGADLGPNNLWMQNGDRTFTNKNLETGIAAATHFHSTWAPLGEDFDLDGRADIFVSSAGVVDADEDMKKMALIFGGFSHVPKQHDLLFWNDGPAGWSSTKLLHRPGQQPSVVFAASAVGDPDGDGDLDILVGAGVPLQLRLLRNDQPHGNYLVIDPEGTTSNKDGIGAEVSLVEGGKVWQMRTVGTQGSLGSSWRRAHFGLGVRTSVSEVRVRWPSGKTQTLGPVNANQVLAVKEP